MASKQIEALAVFTKEDGLLHLSGIQALLRLALDQVRADRRRALPNTGVRRVSIKPPATRTIRARKDFARRS